MKQNWLFGDRFHGIGDSKEKILRSLITDYRSLFSRLGDKNNQVERAISTGQLHALPRVHIRPIDVVVFHGSSRENLF